MITATRYHDISCGHRVVGHESKCKAFHGHNYRVHFTVESTYLDEIGRVLDFGIIKERLCLWLEENWDHKMLLYSEDPTRLIFEHVPAVLKNHIGIVEVPFNPTAENMAKYLVEKVGPSALCGTGVRLVRVTIEETRKCSATYEVVREA